MRLKFNFFMRSNLFNNIDQEVNTLIMQLKPKKALLATFNLMSNLLAGSAIMRSKFKKALLTNFNLMNDLLATSAIKRSKVFMHRWLKIRAKN
jgi:hypothetical protein